VPVGGLVFGLSAREPAVRSPHEGPGRGAVRSGPPGRRPALMAGGRAPKLALRPDGPPAGRIRGAARGRPVRPGAGRPRRSAATRLPMPGPGFAGPTGSAEGSRRSAAPDALGVSRPGSPGRATAGYGSIAPPSADQPRHHRLSTRQARSASGSGSAAPAKPAIRVPRRFPPARCPSGACPATPGPVIAGPSPVLVTRPTTARTWPASFSVLVARPPDAPAERTGPVARPGRLRGHTSIFVSRSGRPAMRPAVLHRAARDGGPGDSRPGGCQQ
jgi:hypothetical protein